MKNATRISLLLAFLGGVLLFLSDQPVGLWPLQLVALVPLLLAVRRVPGRRHAALAGVAFALGYGGPLTMLLAFPWWATALEVG